MLRRSMGFDVPDFLASGPRDVMVPASGVDAARDVLLQAELLPGPAAGPSPTRLLGTMLAVLGVVAACIWAVDAIF